MASRSAFTSREDRSWYPAIVLKQHLAMRSALVTADLRCGNSFGSTPGRLLYACSSAFRTFSITVQQQVQGTFWELLLCQCCGCSRTGWQPERRGSGRRCRALKQKGQHGAPGGCWVAIFMTAL